MVEAVIIRNTVTGAMLDLNTTDDPNGYYIESVLWEEISSKHNTYKFSGQVGEYVASSVLGTRDLSIVGTVVARNDDQMDERKHFLNTFVNPLQKMTLEYKGYILSFLPQSTIIYGTSEPNNNEIICKFKIEGFCADPLFADAKETKVDVATTFGLFHFPLTISPELPEGGVVFGLRTPTVFSSIRNVGDVPTGMIIRFKALSSVKNPCLTNVNTSEFFRVNKTMVAGEVIDINTNLGSKYVRGYLNKREYNYFPYRDLNSDWLQLDTGDNVFRYSAEEKQDMLEVYVYFSDKYLEVQGCR